MRDPGLFRSICRIVWLLTARVKERIDGVRKIRHPDRSEAAMQLSEARIKSNQANSLKSTGPKTPEGRRQSRKNALKHGLCSEVVGLEEPEAVLDRAKEIAPLVRPSEGLDGWAAGQAAVLSLRIERCQASERAIRERVVARAELTWDDDRRLEAILLAETLGKRPEQIAARLMETYHGCEWLIGRWAMLAYSARDGKSWTTEQGRLAFDLVGTPPEFRQGNRPGTTIDTSGMIIDPTEGELAFALRQVAELEERRDTLQPLDDAARERAQADLAADEDPELKRLRRYEVSLQRRMKWSIDLLQKLASLPATSDSQSEPGNQPEATPTEESLEARPTVEQAEPSSKSQLPRAERRLIKAESRRESRKRKLDKRRN
jgi:hypothetical protein